MTKAPAFWIGLVATVIASSSPCYSAIIKGESRFDKMSRSQTEISRGLVGKQQLIAYGHQPNNGGTDRNDGEETSATNLNENMIFGRPSGTGSTGKQQLIANSGGSGQDDSEEEERRWGEGDMEDRSDPSEQQAIAFDRPSGSGDFDDLLLLIAPEDKDGTADRMQILGPQCQVGVNIGCVGSDDIGCDQLQVPSTQCSIGEDVMKLGIKVISSDCHQSRTTQDDHYFCDTTGSIPDDGGVVQVACFEGSGSWEQLAMGYAFVGETEINIEAGEGGLPKSLMCIVYSDRTEIQRVKFDTSGTVDLFLKNAFGMFQIESCTVGDRPTQSCKMPVQYSYTVANLGTLPLNLMKVERRRNSDIVDLTPQTSTIELRAGDETTSIVEDDILDLCMAEYYETTITASSDSSAQGMPCFDQSAYTFQFPGIGHMDIEIDCQSSDGLNCTDLGQKEENCWTPVTYTFDVKNVGTTDLIITYVEVLQKGNELDMASFFLDNEILPSEKTSVTYEDTINLCVDGDYETTVTVKAESTINRSTEAWENYETYQFEVKITPYPTKAPTTEKPSGLPSSSPTDKPTAVPSPSPSLQPTTSTPSNRPTPISSTIPTLMSSDGPTNVPTSVPTQELSSNPTMVHSGEPTATASAVISTYPSSVASTHPTVVTSVVPSPIPSAAPTTSSSKVPTSQPSILPTSNPTPPKINAPPLLEDPTSFPTKDPSKQPTELPTSSPTHSPSLIPSPSPSLIPSISPTQNPTEQCTLEFDITCIAPTDISPDGSCSFNHKQPNVCQEQPARLQLRYNGGDCSRSANLQANTFFICEDYGTNNFGPSYQDGSIVFIRINDYGDSTAIRFDGFVRVGEDFAINGMGPNLNVTVYDPKSLQLRAEIVKPENILQTLVFHTTCPAPTSNLYLKDRFGSIQIIEFENSLQGVVSSYQELTLNVEIRSDFEVDLLSTNIVTNIDNGSFGIYNLTDLASGTRISKSQPFRTTQKVTIDLSRRKPYTAQGVVVGKRTLGNECYGSGETTFLAGAPLPPSIPTVPPTVAPSASAAPSTDPLFTRCDLEASISCTTSDGGSCSDLKAPLDTTCLGESAEQLSFTYIPSSNCNMTNSQDRFRCSDFNLDEKRPFTSFIRVFRGTDVFYEGVVSAGQLFRVPLPSNTKEIEAAVYTVSSSESAGTLLERMELSVACRQKDDLTLLQKYGHLQLNGFVNENMGSKQIFANLDLTYTVRNNGIFDALLTMATTDSPFTGIGDEVLPTNGPRRTIERGEMLSFTESATLNLIAALGQDFDFFFEVGGVSAFNNFVCSDIGELSLQIR